MAVDNYKLGKRYMLCSKKTIDEVFESGHSIKSYPFIVSFKPTSFEDDVPFKVVVSAPKRIFKSAVERNRAKRICKEAIRLNKKILEEYLLKRQFQIAIFVVYTAKEEMTFDTLQKKTLKLFNAIITNLDEHDN